MTDLTSLEESVLQSVDSAELWRSVEYLSQVDRTSATEGEYEAVDWLAAKLAEYGISYEVHEFEGYLSFPIRATLRILAPEQREIRAKTRAFGANTPPQGLEGELVFVPSSVAGIGFQALDNQYEGYDVRGKIVLSPRGGPDGVYDAMKAGAIAHIHYWPSPEDAIHEMIATTVWGAPTPESASRIPSIPSISVNNESGLYLRSLCEQGPVKVRLLAQTETGWRKLKLPVATIPAAEETGDYFLVGGHLDAWYVGVTDNATGSAAMLELARILHAHRDQLKRGVKVGWWVGHSYGRYSGLDVVLRQLLQRPAPATALATWTSIRPGSRARQSTTRSARWPRTGTSSRAVFAMSPGRRPVASARRARATTSFHGAGLPAMFMLMGNLPKEQRFNVGGSGMGWWWHAEYDTLEVGRCGRAGAGYEDLCPCHPADHPEHDPAPIVMPRWRTSSSRP